MELVQNENVPVPNNQARVNITWSGQNGDLPEPVPADAGAEDVKRWATEAVRAGTVPGIRADAAVDFANFVVDRFDPTEQRPHRLIMLRPKTEYGG